MFNTNIVYPSACSYINPTSLSQISLSPRSWFFSVSILFNTPLLLFWKFAIFLKLTDILSINYHLRLPFIFQIFSLFEIFLCDIKLNIENGSHFSEAILVGRDGWIIRFTLKERSNCVNEEEDDENIIKVKAWLLLSILSLLWTSKSITVLNINNVRKLWWRPRCWPCIPKKALKMSLYWSYSKSCPYAPAYWFWRRGLYSSTPKRS